MSQQTAVQWLENQLKSTYMIEGKLPLAYTLDLVRQAKEMEKEQIVAARMNGMTDDELSYVNAEQYYNDTYTQCNE